MRYCRLLFLVFVLLVVAGCRPPDVLLEQEDLVTYLYNKVTDHALIVYLRPDGLERRVVRHGGRMVVMLEQKGPGEYVLVEPDAVPRRLEMDELRAQFERIDALVYGEDAEETPSPGRDDRGAQPKRNAI